MLSTTPGEETSYNNKTLNSVSSSVSASLSPFSPYYHNSNYNNNNNYNTQQKFKTMEDVWKDIASLHDHPSTDKDFNTLPSSHNHNSNCILQDFFARPTRTVSSTTTTNTTNTYGSTVPATVLSLKSSAPVFDFLDNSVHLPPNPVSNVISFNNPFEDLSSSCFGKKRVQESDTSSCDRRHKRMIKNRESAARSRARKQAYTSELELEKQRLEEENAILKSQQKQLYPDAAAQLPKKHSLHRTSTAPF